MIIIQEYQRLTEEIAVIDSKIQSAERELRKLSATYAPAGVSGIDYSKDRVTGGPGTPDLVDVVCRMTEINMALMDMRAELQDLRSQRDKLQEVIESVGNQHKKVLMYKIEGLSNAQIARRMNRSKRHVERLVSEVRGKTANC